MGLIGVFFTSIYSLRLLVYVFHRENLADEKVIAHIHESPFIMLGPLFFLAVGAIFVGYFFKTTSIQKEQRELLMFITPTVYD